MAESIKIKQQASKKEKYQSLLPQIKALISGETNIISKMANIAAALKETFDFFWVGFYLFEKDSLKVGPFQGPVACMKIKIGEGVCGKSFKDKKPIIVPDVNAFPGHIACNTNSKSEIVIPIFHNGSAIAVLDVDSDQLNDFDATDEQYLKAIVELIDKV